MDIDINALIDKSRNTLSKLINKRYFPVKTTGSPDELFETLEIMKNCTSCKDNARKYNLDEFHRSMNEIENCLAELEKEEQKQGKSNIICWLDRLAYICIYIGIELNQKVLCESCKGKKIEKLTERCENEEIARFLYQCKPDGGYIRWIPFDKFRNIKYLAKGSFGEVHKATWINCCYNEHERKYEDGRVALKRIYNSSSKIADILKEVK